MPGLTRTAVRTRIRHLLAEPTARHFTDSAINTWINDGVRDVSIKTFCNTVIVTTGITTTSGISTYSWPSAMGTVGLQTSIATLGIKTIVTSNNISLDYITPEQIGRVAGIGSDQMKWTCWNEKIVLSHVPTATLTLIPYIWIEGRQTAQGTLNLPNMYHHLVTMYGVYMGHLKRLELELAQSVYNMYIQELNRIISQINTHYIPEPMKEGIQDIGETP